MNKYGKDDFHGDDYLNSEDEDAFEFPEEHLYKVLDTMKECSEMLLACDTLELCDEYKKLFPAQFGIYTISENRLKRLNAKIINDTLMDLVKKDLVEMTWDDKLRDFVFRNKNLSGA